MAFYVPRLFNSKNFLGAIIDACQLLAVGLCRSLIHQHAADPNMHLV